MFFRSDREKWTFTKFKQLQFEICYQLITCYQVKIKKMRFLDTRQLNTLLWIRYLSATLERFSLSAIAVAFDDRKKPR